MNATGNTTIDNFILKTALVDPVTNIIKKLEEGNFRDCDIKWLDGKLYAFTKVALEMQMLNNMILPESNGFTSLNEYTKNKYKGWFGTLLDCFHKYTP